MEDQPPAQSSAPSPASSPAPAPERKTYRARFEGNASEFFGIWIVNLILSILTIGIYSAWAKVRTNRYFYGNTYIDDTAFEYTADPVKILKGRLLAVGLFMALQAAGYLSPQVANYAGLGIALAFPALLVMAMRFRMHYSSWRGIRFGFRTDFRAAYLLFSPLVVFALIIGFMNAFVPTEPTEINSEEIAPQFMVAMYAFFGAMALAALLFPWWQNRYYMFLGNRTRYGQHDFSYRGGAGGFYLFYGIALGIAIAGIALPAMLLGAIGEGVPAAVGLLLILFTMLGYAAAIAYILTARTNLVYSRLAIGDITTKSELRYRRMLFLYITNTLAIVFSLGLAIPWAKIRMARYRAETFTVHATSLDHMVAAAGGDEQATAEEIADVFAWDFGL